MKMFLLKMGANNALQDASIQLEFIVSHTKTLQKECISLKLIARSHFLGHKINFHAIM